jgi:hypothetical protein
MGGLAKTRVDGNNKTLAAINMHWPIMLALFISAHLDTVGDGSRLGAGRVENLIHIRKQPDNRD